MASLHLYERLLSVECPTNNWKLSRSHWIRNKNAHPAGPKRNVEPPSIAHLAIVDSRAPNASMEVKGRWR